MVWKIIRVAMFLMMGVGSATAEVASPWVSGHNARTRLIAGADTADGKPRAIAGVEIAMASGWKTYWRNPGDAGGIPPFFDWTGSENLAEARVLYPAPHRLKDSSGESIGYKDAVTLPVHLTAKDPLKPIKLKLAMEYGVCREICIPAEAKLELTLPAAAIPMPPALAAALDAVPRAPAARRTADPVLKSARAMLAGDKPVLKFEVSYPGGASDGDAFVEAPDGIYLNMPKKISGDGDAQAFAVDLSNGVDVAALKGKTITITMVGGKGQTEATWKID